MTLEMNSIDEDKGVIRVLLIMHGAGSGGVETALGTLCKYLDRGRVRFTIAVSHDGPFSEKVQAMGLEVVKTPIEWWTPSQWELGERHYYRFLSALKERVKGIVQLIEDKGIDVVHSSTLPVLDGALAAMIAGKPHIWNIRGHFYGGAEQPFGSYLPIQTLYDIVADLSSRIVANSYDIKMFLEKYLPKDKVEVIHNGVDLARFKAGSDHSAGLERDFPGLAGKLKVALIGRIALVKGIEDFVEAAVRVGRSRRDVGFIVVGVVQDEDLLEKTISIIAQAGLTERVVFTGQRKDIPSVLREIDLLVCASLREGLPNSVLEAMSAGLPVVATRCGGAEELVVDGETGLLVRVGDPARLGEAIMSVISDPEAMKKMGDAGRRRVESRFSGQACAEQFEKLYRDILENRNNERSYSPWPDVLMGFASDIGSLGSRVMEHERLIRGLKDFEALFKNNFLYRTLRACYGALSSKMKH